MKISLRLILAALASLAVAAPAQAAVCKARSQKAHRVSIKVHGQKSKAFAALPKRKPRSLIVVAHGYSWTAASWKTKLRSMAKRDRAVAVAPEFRGLKFRPSVYGYPKSRGIPLHNAIADLNAYGRSYVRRCKSIKTVVLVGYSIGGIYSGNALMRHPKRPGGKRRLFDYYVGMEAIEDVFGEFSLAKAIGGDPFVKGAIDDAAEELGGTIDEKPAAYHRVSPIEHIKAIRKSRVRGVILVHGIDDGLVPYTQAKDMTKALRKGHVKTDLYTAYKRRPGDTPDTTLSGRLGQESGNTGHAADWATRHLVPATGLHVIRDLLVRHKRPKNRTRHAQG
jgi:hypothetical protein